MTQDSSQALVNTGISLTAASLTLTQVQPFVTLVAGLTAIMFQVFLLFVIITMQLKKYKMMKFLNSLYGSWIKVFTFCSYYNDNF